MCVPQAPAWNSHSVLSGRGTLGLTRTQQGVCMQEAHSEHLLIKCTNGSGTVAPRAVYSRHMHLGGPYSAGEHSSCSVSAKWSTSPPREQGFQKNECVHETL